MRGGLQREDYQHDPKFRLLSASCLTALECEVGTRDLKRGSKVIDDEEEDEGEEEDDEEDVVEGSDGGPDGGPDDELEQDMLMAQAESLHLAKAVTFLTSVVPN